MIRRTRPKFIAFEGGEASGKSTQAARLAARLGAVRTHEPGATPVGAALRAVLLDPTVAGLDPRAEALMLATDRAQHVAEVVRPELDAGRHVVTDRYIGSSLAYQGYGRGLPLDEVRRLSVWASGGLWPDLTILLDVPIEVAAARATTGRPDRLEAEDVDFHRRVLDGFRHLAAEEAHPWVSVDGTAGVDDVEAAVWSAVRDRWPDLVSANAGGAGDTGNSVNSRNHGSAARREAPPAAHPQSPAPGSEDGG